jgi:hypothetical protein
MGVKARPSTQRNRGSRGLERERRNAIRVAGAKEKQNPTTRKRRRGREERGKIVAADKNLTESTTEEHKGERRRTDFLVS